MQRDSGAVHHRTEFPVTLPQIHLDHFSTTVTYDPEDIEDRRHPKRIVVYHTLATKLQDVGCQVWSASLVLADWWLHAWKHGGHSDRTTMVLELGAGVGLPSLVAGACGADVLLTDSSLPALDLAQRSWDANAVWIKPRGGTVKVLARILCSSLHPDSVQSEVFFITMYLNAYVTPRTGTELRAVQACTTH